MTKIRTENYSEYIKTLSKPSIAMLMSILVTITEHQNTFGAKSTEYIDFLYGVMLMAQGLIDEATEDKQ